MANVLGIGGVFFKCRDHDRLIEWYREHLGFEIGEDPGVSFPLARMPAGGFSVWGPFRTTTEYFAPSDKEFMINLVVDDLDGVLARAGAGGAELVGGIEEYPFGRFGWFIDPEGIKVELWQLPLSGEPEMEDGG